MDNTSRLENLRHLAEATALLAGGHLLAQRGDWSEIEKAAHHDVKLAADRMAEELIVARLREASPFAILSEEAGLIPGLDDVPENADMCWLVDPLDGSLNYARGQPSCCVSIALCRAGEPILGVIFDFNRNELFSGDIHSGAWLNGAPMVVSTVSNLSEAVLGTGFPSYLDHSDATLAAFIRQVQGYRKIRGLGSAALMLAYVACGRMDAYQEKSIALWDVAAGVALVRAAGGKSTMAGGGDLAQKLDVIAWNGHFEPA